MSTTLLLTPGLVMILASLPLLAPSVCSATTVLPQEFTGENLFIQQGPGALDLFIRFRALPGESCSDLAWRILERAGGCASLDRYRMEGSEGVYRIALELVGPGLRSRILRSIFPKDRIGPDGWLHRVTYGPTENGPGETLWSLAELFCGSGSKHRAIRSASGLETDALELGQELRIPMTLLEEGLVRNEAEEVQVGELTFARDEKGEYAAYRLKAREALYSSVIIRFTDLVTGKEVLKAAERVMERSGIPDARNIPVGREIRIPRDMISAQFLPPSDPIRRRYEAEMAEARSYSRGERAEQLAGVKVVLDPGHGGRDPGTIGQCGLCEDEVVYDVACRLRHLLLAETRAQVEITLEDPATGFAPRVRLRGTEDLGERIRTHPPYACRDNRTAVHLRWYLANSIYRKARAEKLSSDRVVFMSIHADALHPSTRGVMVYVPGASLRTGSFGKRGSVYDRRAEVREKRYVKFSRQERFRAEGLSRKLAEHVVRSFREHGLAVHRNRPIRSSIVRRGRRRWVPAVLRYNETPTAILVELVNLQNQQDCRDIARAEVREKMARSLLDALLGYYE